MSYFHSRAFHPNGRIRGSYVYMLMCEDADSIFIKVGMSDTPLARLQTLLTSCPYEPGVFAIAELPTRRIAITVETELHHALDRWLSAREWFRFKIEDKTEFNQAWKEVFAHFSRPAWPIKWNKLSTKTILEEGRRRMRYIQSRQRKNGKAYRDFTRQQRFELNRPSRRIS